VISAAASGFVIEVATTQPDARLLLDATADDGGGTNTVRAVVDYRPSTGETATACRRVLK